MFMLSRLTSSYIISTSVANKIKDKFYSQDLPELEDVRRSEC